MATSEAELIRKLVEERYAAVREGDFFAVLAVGREAGEKEVQQAYFDLAKRIHPDKIASQGLDDLRDRALALFQFATQAKDALSDKVKRAKYLRGELAVDVPPAGGDRTANRARNAEEVGKISFHKGSVMLNKRAYAEAEKYLRQAVEAMPDNPRYLQSLGWAVFQNVDGRPEKQRLEEARRYWERAIEMTDSSAQPHYYMALYHKALGDMRACQSELERALYLDSNHVDAKREIRLIRMRAAKTRQRKAQTGLISRLVTSLKGKK